MIIIKRNEYEVVIKRKKKSERTIIIKIQVIFLFLFLVKDIAAVEILPYSYLAAQKKYFFSRILKGMSKIFLLMNYNWIHRLALAYNFDSCCLNSVFDELCVVVHSEFCIDVQGLVRNSWGVIDWSIPNEMFSNFIYQYNF